MTWMWMWLGCAPTEAPSVEPAPVSTADTAYHLDLPHHDECLPIGQEMTDEVCAAVIEHDGRLPGESFDKSNVEPEDPDPRFDDPDVTWLESEIRRCTCSCCHQSDLGGPGAYFWDLDFEPMWLDSASMWSLRVLAGIYESENQRLPTSDPARLVRVVEAEIERRDRLFVDPRDE